MNRREIVDWLKQRRLEVGETQAAVGEKISGSRDPKQVCRWEKHLHDPALGAVIAYADSVGAEVVVRVKA